MSDDERESETGEMDEWTYVGALAALQFLALEVLRRIYGWGLAWAFVLLASGALALVRWGANAWQKTRAK